MKKELSGIVAVSVLLSSAAAQNNLFSEFGSCQYSDCFDTSAQCCTFIQQPSPPGLMRDFCMTPEQQLAYQFEGIAHQGSYTDNLAVTWNWYCKQQSNEEDDPIHDLDEDVYTPYGWTNAEWMNYIIGLQFGSGMLWILGLPFYLVFASIGFGYNIVQVWYGFWVYYLVNYLGENVSGDRNYDLRVYTLINLFDFPVRRLWLYTIVTIVGAFTLTFPVANWISMPALGVGAFYNELY